MSEQAGPSGEQIDPLDALEAATAGRAILVDVRSDEEWSAGHVAGAFHLPLDEIEGSAVPPISDDRVVVTVCGGGGRAGRAAEALRARGVEARAMTGGQRAWVAAGLPLDAPGDTATPSDPT